MSFSRSSIMERPMSLYSHEHHIAYAFNVRITGVEFTDHLTPTQFWLNSLGAGVRKFVIDNSKLKLSQQSTIELLDWTLLAIFDQKPSLCILRIHAHIRLLEAFHTYHPTPDQHAILVLPSLIDFAGSTAIIDRIHAVTFFAWNTCSENTWLVPPAHTYLSIKTSRTLPQP